MKVTESGDQDNYINIYVQKGEDLKKKRNKVSSGSSGDMSNLYSVKAKREVDKDIYEIYRFSVYQ